MPLTIIKKGTSKNSRQERLMRVIEEVSHVDAVAGIKEIILRQEDRVNKLRDHENRVAFLLPELSDETRLLRDMYTDVIKFQTSASVLAHMRQELSGKGLVSEVTDLTLEIANKEEVQSATMKALALLQLNAN